MSVLSATQLNGLAVSQLAAINLTQATALTAQQITGLTSTSFEALGSTNVQALNATQIGGLTAARLMALGNANLDMLTTNQIQEISGRRAWGAQRHPVRFAGRRHSFEADLCSAQRPGQRGLEQSDR